MGYVALKVGDQGRPIPSVFLLVLQGLKSWKSYLSTIPKLLSSVLASAHCGGAHAAETTYDQTLCATTRSRAQLMCMTASS